MEPKYLTLKTIFNIVKNDPHPLSYSLHLREILVRHLEGWDVVQQHINQLVADELIVLRQLDIRTISITQSGLDKFLQEEAIA